MKSKRIRIWVISAVLYLALVMVGYYTLTGFSGNTNSQQNQYEAGHKESTEETHDENSGKAGDKHTESDSEHGDHGQSTHQAGENEVVTNINYDGSIMTIKVNDLQGNPVTGYEINHEKLMHLIVVSHDLEDYYHFHPTLVGDGQFQLETELPVGSYQVFTDIQLEGYSYHTTPVSLQVGEQATHGHREMVADTTLTKTIDGVTVKMTPETFETGSLITLTFMIDGSQPEPYLGALGHIVILDEEASNYVHVHPVSDQETNFETQFNEPGIYKIWAEFQFEGKVHVYPFVVEVK